MIGIVLAFLVLLFILGYIQIPGLPLDITLIHLLGRNITLYDLIVFIIILWMIELLPWPFRGLAFAVLILWLLSFFGLIAISGFSSILLLALIVGVILYLFKGFSIKG